MNTEKIAKVMAETMNADIAKVEDVQPEDLAKYDLIGLGSGIYGSGFHKKIDTFIEKMPNMNKNVFLFFTSAHFGAKNLYVVKDKLSVKGYKIIGDFCCSGEYSPFGLNFNCKGKLSFIAGREKGHPDEKDMESARVFAKSLLNL
jgi:Flavodoxins